MERRSLLRRGLPVVLAGLAGCTGDGDGGGSGDGSGDGAGGGYGGSGGSGAATATDSPTPTRTDAEEPTAPTDPDPGTGTGSPTSTPTGTAGPTATPAESPTSTPTATPEPDQRVVVAPGGEFRFEPESFTVDRGDTVLWVWEGTGHNVSDGAKPADADWSGDDETTYAAGHTYAYTFEVAGSYEYHCDPHQSLGMEGSFTVE